MASKYDDEISDNIARSLMKGTSRFTSESEDEDNFKRLYHSGVPTKIINQYIPSTKYPSTKYSPTPYHNCLWMCIDDTRLHNN